VSFEPFQVIKQNSAMLFAFGHAKCDPPRKRGAIFGNKRAIIQAAGFQQERILRVNIGGIFPGGHMVNIDPRASLSQRTRHISGNVRVEKTMV
jgi:hypothetical protein